MYLLKDLRAEYTQALFVAVNSKADQFAMEATAWMKANAPWTDQTGDARNSLRAYVNRYSDKQREDQRLAYARADTKDAAMLKKYQKLVRSLDVDIFEGLDSGPGPKDLAKGYKGVSSTKRRRKHWSEKATLPTGLMAPRFAQMDNSAPVVQVVFDYAPVRGRQLKYVIWLEIANGGRYSIITKATQHWAPKIMRGVQGMINLGLISKGPPKESFPMERINRTIRGTRRGRRSVRP